MPSVANTSHRAAGRVEESAAQFNFDAALASGLHRRRFDHHRYELACEKLKTFGVWIGCWKICGPGFRLVTGVGASVIQAHTVWLRK